MRNDPTDLKVLKIGLGILMLVAEGCSSTGGQWYMPTLRSYPGCVSQAQISQVKIDGCMDSTDQTTFNSCLVSKSVPQSKIDVLNNCVNTHRRSTIGNILG